MLGLVNGRLGCTRMSFLSELKRRKVLRTGGGFLVAVWVAIQVVDVVGPELGLPDWVLTTVIVCSIIGLPIVLVLAWVYDLKSTGLARSGDAPESLVGAKPKGAARWAEMTLFVMLLIAVAYLLTDKLFLSPNEVVTLPDGRRSVAVLPFDNLSDDPGQQYLVDGIAEEILNALATVRDLRVTSRTSSFALRDSDLTTREIADLLGVDYIVEGSVRRSGQTARVTVQLIQAKSDAHLMSDNFDISLGVTELLEVQEAVARRISDRLQVRVLPGDELQGNPPANLAALDYYLDGRSYLRRIETLSDTSDEVFRSAIERFEASIEADPEWAPSRAALGATYHFWLSPDNFDDAWQRSYEQIQEALRIDPAYEPGWISLAYLHLRKYDFEAVLEAQEKVITPSRNRSWSKAILMFTFGRFEQAVEHFRAAWSFDPLSNLIRLQYAESLVCAAKYRESIDFIEETRADLSATNYPTYRMLPELAYAYAKVGNDTMAGQIADAWLAEDDFQLAMAPVLALLGRKDEASAILAGVDAANSAATSFFTASAAAILGDPDHALTILESALSESPGNLYAFNCYEEIRELSGNPRYDQILIDLGIPEDYR